MVVLLNLGCISIRNT